jgi:hypothetical protein
VQVRCTEGLANHSGPESCAGIREGASEALAGERAGQPLSRERLSSRMPTRFETWKAIRTGALMRAPGRPGVVGDPGMLRTLLVREPGDLGFDRRRTAGPCREGEEP